MYIIVHPHDDVDVKFQKTSYLDYTQHEKMKLLYNNFTVINSKKLPTVIYKLYKLDILVLTVQWCFNEMVRVESVFEHKDRYFDVISFYYHNNIIIY